MKSTERAFARCRPASEQLERDFSTYWQVAIQYGEHSHQRIPHRVRDQLYHGSEETQLGIRRCIAAEEQLDHQPFVRIDRCLPRGELLHALQEKQAKGDAQSQCLGCHIAAVAAVLVLSEPCGLEARVENLGDGGHIVAALLRLCSVVLRRPRSLKVDAVRVA